MVNKNPLKKAILNLRRHRGMNDCLSYLVQCDPATIRHKDGSLSRTFRYFAPDASSCTDHELDYFATTWKQALGMLGDGWMLETNLISQPFLPTNQSREFPELVSALIDDERRLQFEGKYYFSSAYYLTLTLKPAKPIASRLRRFAIDEKSPVNDADYLWQQFEKTVHDFVGFLSRALIRIEPLTGNELTSFLHYCLTGQSDQLASPTLGHFLDTYLSSEDFIAGFDPQIGKKHIKVLALDDLPSVSYPNILALLSQFPVSYRWSSRVVTLDPLTSTGYLKRYERTWSSKAIGILGVIRESFGMPSKRDEGAQMIADELRAAQHENQSGQVHYGFYNSALILMHENKEELNKIVDTIITRIQQLNFKVRIESVNAVEAYLGSLPSHGDYNLRKMMVDSPYLSHALPTSSLYQGEQCAPCPLAGYDKQPALLLCATDGNRPFMLNLHVNDVGHTAILGPTGSGKSTLIGALIAAHRQYKNSRIIVLDNDYSNRILIKSLNGAYFDLSQQDCQLAPLAKINPSEPYQIDKALQWLKECMQLQGVDVTPKRQRYLREAIERLATEPAHYKTLNHLTLQDPTLREALATLNKGGLGELLNGVTPMLHETDVLGFEMGALMQGQHDKQDLSLIAIKAIFNELEDCFQDKRPTLLILEEAWAYLKHPLFQDKLTDWFKTLRKQNVAVLFISQDIADIAKSESASTIQSSCMTRIYLPNASALEPAIKTHYEAFGLNERQIEIIQHAIPKQDYYFKSPQGTRLFRLDLNELAQSFLCVSKKEEIKQFNQLYKKDDPTWVLAWLKHKGLGDWADFVREHYLRENA